MVINKKSFVFSFFVMLVAIFGVILNSMIICRISVFGILALCIYRGLQEKSLINPYFLFSLTPFTLVIYANISNYTMDLSVETWILAIINIVFFLVAVEFTGAYKQKDKCIGLGEGKDLTRNVVILAIMGYAPSLIKLVFHRLMPLASVFQLFSIVAVVGAFKSKSKKLITILCAIHMFFWLGYVSKSQILMFCLAILVCYEKYYVETRKQKSKLIVFLLIALLVMILAFSFANQGRGSKSGLDAVQYYTKYGNLTWSGNDYLLMPYMYLTTPWANLQYVVMSQDTRTYGLWMMKPFISYLQIDKYFERYYEMKAYSNFNTFTYIATQFRDFGYWGSIISSSFLGFFTKKIYSRYLVSKSALDVACYILVGIAVLEMFFSNEFYTQSFPFTIVIISGIYKRLFCKSNCIELEK